MQDLRAVSERPNADLGPRPEHPRRMQAWAIVDQFLDAARWIWRARRCDGQVGRDCYREFNQTLGRIERSARNGSLAECELIIGTIRLWRRQAASLLNDLSGRSTLVQVKLGDWRKVYLELDALCPWRQAEKELLRYWQPGRTEVVYVEEQPFAGAADAVSDAAARNSASTVLVHCDPKRWQDAPISASEFCIFFCTEIAAKLHATDMLPDEAVLRSLDAAALRDLVEKLCAADPNRSVVLFIENLHLLEEALTPKTDWERAIDFLDRIEDEIGNLALTVHSCDGDYVWQRFQNQCKSPHLFRPVPVRLLPLDGVEQWLDRLFSTTGLYFTEEAHAETYRITGGHPFLLASLANCIAADYNGQVSSAPICPRIDAQQVTAAATAKRYQADARRFSTAFARQLDHDTDSERRLLLYLLARATRRGATDCTSRILSNDSAPYDQLSVPAIEAILGPWIDSEVVTTKLDGGDVNYTLRIFSFAEWVAGEKPTINNLT